MKTEKLLNHFLTWIDDSTFWKEDNDIPNHFIVTEYLKIYPENQSQPIEKEQHITIYEQALNEWKKQCKEQEQEIDRLKDLVETMKQGILKGDHLYGNLIFDEETKSQLMKQAERIRELESQLKEVNELAKGMGSFNQIIKASESSPTEQPE